MAYLAKEEGSLEQFAIAQAVSASSEGEELSLPSFIYFPLEEELKKLSSFMDNSRLCVGGYARDRGAEVPARLVASAKSWLCHAGIDRREDFLPLGEEDHKISPLDACAEILLSLRKAWDKKMAHAPFSSQQILVTVPASFDPSARQLVQEAAEKAGYPDIILLEEPQAAFYSWLQGQEDAWRKQLSVGDTVLVVDIGGGTTDFSLIAVENYQGDLSLKRLAVGAHLLLGGDNIDLALAYLAKGKLEAAGHVIDDWQLNALTHACRAAKEKLLQNKPPKSVDVTIMGRGSKLIGGSLKATLEREEVQKLVVDGFFPLVGPDQWSPTERRLGFQQRGLPYAQDARISCQLAKFLSLTGDSDSSSMERFVVPSAVLFNGGTLKAPALRQRLLELLNQWAAVLGQNPVKELPGGDLDFAVSRGAAYYGLARSGKAVRIKSGTSHSYFIGVEDAVPAIPGMPIPLKAVCIAPFGMEEGCELALEGQEFAMILGQPASFRFFSCSTPALPDGTNPVMGTVVRRWQQDLGELHPIESRMDRMEGDGKTINVKLKSRVTELGFLELWCVAPDERKWKLEFSIRKKT
jgi:molecular chaperone DnaK (HSP70)